MATRRPRPDFALSRRFSLLAAFLAALTTFTIVPVGGALADPRLSPAAARRELARIDAALDAVVEQYNDARIELAATQRRAATVQARVARAEADLRTLRARMGSFAAAAYRSGGMDQLVALVTTSDPQVFLDQATTIDRIARDQAGQLRAVSAAGRRLKSEQHSARAALDAQRAVTRRLDAARRSIESKLARQQELLDIVETRAARAARAAREAATARRERASRSIRAYSGPASGRARIAVAEAYRQLGKPYRWGASGPNSFDCSGLTMWVWGKAGVSLPHSSRAQYGHGTRVSRSELAPGDLVFFGHPIHHVGIYVGGGRYIAAPRTGDVVGFRSVGRGDYVGAVRL